MAILVSGIFLFDGVTAAYETALAGEETVASAGATAEAATGAGLEEGETAAEGGAAVAGEGEGAAVAGESAAGAALAGVLAGVVALCEQVREASETADANQQLCKLYGSHVLALNRTLPEIQRKHDEKDLSRNPSIVSSLLDMRDALQHGAEVTHSACYRSNFLTRWWNANSDDHHLEQALWTIQLKEDQLLAAFALADRPVSQQSSHVVSSSMHKQSRLNWLFAIMLIFVLVLASLVLALYCVGSEDSPSLDDQDWRYAP